MQHPRKHPNMPFCHSSQAYSSRNVHVREASATTPPRTQKKWTTVLNMWYFRLRSIYQVFNGCKRCSTPKCTQIWPSAWVWKLNWAETFMFGKLPPRLQRQHKRSEPLHWICDIFAQKLVLTGIWGRWSHMKHQKAKILTKTCLIFQKSQILKNLSKNSRKRIFHWHRSIYQLFNRCKRCSTPK